MSCNQHITHARCGRCDTESGYILQGEGDAVRTCAQDGAYNGTAEKCGPGKVINGSVTLSGSNNSAVCSRFEAVVRVIGDIYIIQGSDALTSLGCLANLQVGLNKINLPTISIAVPDRRDSIQSFARSYFAAVNLHKKHIAVFPASGCRL